MRRVLVYRGDLLPLSETFILRQVQACRRWHPVLVGMRRVRGGLDLGRLDVAVLRPDPPGPATRLYWRVMRKLGTVPPHALKRVAGASLVHAHFGPDALDAWPLAQALRVPMLVTLHGYDIGVRREWWEAGHGGKAMRRYPARLLALAREPRVRFIAVSRALMQRAIAFGIPEDKIGVQYIGVDREHFAPQGTAISRRGRRVLFVGRLVEKKGCEYLIRAFAQAQADVPDASLIVVGDGPLSAGLRQLADALAVRVEFRGTLSTAEVARELHRARVFCLPSVVAANGDCEGLGISLLEAQACGVPVITSAVGGAEEAIAAGRTGLAFREKDTVSLAAHLKTLLTHDEAVTAMSHAGPRFIAEKFDCLQCTAALEDRYDETVEE